MKTLTEKRGRIPGARTWLRMAQPQPDARVIIAELRASIREQWAVASGDQEAEFAAQLADSACQTLESFVGLRADVDSWRRMVRILAEHIAHLHRLSPWPSEGYRGVLTAIHQLDQCDDEGRQL